MHEVCYTAKLLTKPGAQGHHLETVGPQGRKGEAAYCSRSCRGGRDPKGLYFPTCVGHAGGGRGKIPKGYPFLPVSRLWDCCHQRR